MHFSCVAFATHFFYILNLEEQKMSFADEVRKINENENIVIISEEFIRECLDTMLEEAANIWVEEIKENIKEKVKVDNSKPLKDVLFSKHLINIDIDEYYQKKSNYRFFTYNWLHRYKYHSISNINITITKKQKINNFDKNCTYKFRGYSNIPGGHNGSPQIPGYSYIGASVDGEYVRLNWSLKYEQKEVIEVNRGCLFSYSKKVTRWVQSEHIIKFINTVKEIAAKDGIKLEISEEARRDCDNDLEYYWKIEYEFDY